MIATQATQETETALIQTQENLQTALMKLVGPEGGVFVNRELRCTFKGNDFSNKEKWSVYARRTCKNGGELIVSFCEVPTAQAAYDEAAKHFKRIDEAGICN